MKLRALEFVAEHIHEGVAVVYAIAFLGSVRFCLTTVKRLVK
jgi:hypothetical protein